MNQISLDTLYGDLADGREVDLSAFDTADLSPADQAEVGNLRLLLLIRDQYRLASPEEDASHADATDPAASTPLDHQASDRWGRYVLSEKVGQGSFGAVFRARDPELEFDVALKILHAAHARPELRKRLLLEGRALARIRHPNVVEVLTVETHEEQLGLCMRFVEGETLDAIVHRHALDAREAALIGEDVCSALAVVHEAEIIHRDVKARNVMRDRKGRIVLMDFGAGQSTKADDDRVPAAGTPLYMAPELFTHAPASRCSDVYSVGVLLYYLVTGTYPVTGRSYAEVATAHVTGQRRLLHDARPDLPLAFRQIVERAIAPNPAARYQTAGAMLQALEQLRAGRREPTTNRYLLVPLGVLGIVGVLAGLGILSSRYFNVALGRGGFAHENLWDWIVFGARALALPATLLALILTAAAIPVAFCRVVMASRLGRTAALARMRDACTTLCEGLGLGDASVATSYLLLLSATILIGTLLNFSPLLAAFFTYMPDTDAANLALLSTEHCDVHDAYQATLIIGGVLSTAGWLQVIRISKRQQQALNRWMLAGGIAIVSLTAALVFFPYRMLNHNDFTTATWQGHSCYITGTRGDERLLFCPALPTPRNRVVQASEIAVGTTDESLFWQFATRKDVDHRCVQ